MNFTTKTKNTFRISFAAATVVLLSCMITPAFAQSTTTSVGQTGSTYNNGTTVYQSSQSQGSVCNPNEAAQGQTYATGGQTLNSGFGSLGPSLNPVGTPGAAPGGPGPTFGLNGTGYGQGSLPPTTLDSFVFNSGYDDTIYGDEGSYGPPPYYDFDTIGSGIGSGGLTTGHASSLPSSWGYTSGSY